MFEATQLNLSDKPYIVMDVSDKTLTNFYLLEGLTEQVRLQNIDRDRWPVNTGKIYLELNAEAQWVGLLPMYQSLQETPSLNIIACKR